MFTVSNGGTVDLPVHSLHVLVLLKTASTLTANCKHANRQLARTQGIRHHFCIVLFDSHMQIGVFGLS